jgi:UDP-N-acetylmuramoyl-tripeptide--D-alanyl-D-alanine ligase
MAITIAHNGTTFELNTQLTGSHNGLPAVAAFACSHQLGAPAALIKERIASFQPIFGRCSTHIIENGPVFIADTSKAPFHSIYLPISMMKEFLAPRRRIVIGQISDYAGNPKSKYRDVYRACRQAADQVILVGDHHRTSAMHDDIAAQHFIEKRSVEEAAAYIKDTAIPGEIILLKGSQNLHLERILLSFSEHVRCWEQRCGRPGSCVRCAFYSIPFAQQIAMKKERKTRRRLKASRWERVLTRWIPGLEKRA